jgi:outer membrane protein with beta-barrel domain
MKHFLLFTFLTLLAAAPVALAQNWEVGVGGGTNFYTSQTITNPAGNADAKLATGFLVSAWLGNNTSGMFGGELRYDYEHSDLKLSSDGANVSFGGAQTNALHYDAVLRFASHEARVAPFIVGGVGIKDYSGTGKEQEFQPLSNVALLTKTSQFKPLISVGGGIKFQIASNVQFRVEAHDFLTPFPNQVIAPALGSKVGGWLSDFAIMAGVSFSF